MMIFNVFPYDDNSNDYYTDDIKKVFRNFNTTYVYCYIVNWSKPLKNLGAIDNFPYSYKSYSAQVSKDVIVYRHFTCVDKSYIVIHRGDLKETWICNEEGEEVFAVDTSKKSGVAIRKEFIGDGTKSYNIYLSDGRILTSEGKINIDGFEVDLSTGKSLEISYNDGTKRILNYG